MKMLGFGFFIGLLLVGCGGGGSTTPDKEQPLLGEHSIEQHSSTLSISVEKIQEKLRSSTVKVILPDTGQGSGFLIGNGYVVTNNHIAALSNTLKVALEGEKNLIDAQIIGYAECADLAVIRLDFDTNHDHLEWYDKNISAGMSVASAGFPGDVTSSDGESQYTYTEGIINTTPSLKNTTWASTEVFYHSAQIHGGSSGSPVIELKTGKVVGINYGGTDTRQLAISAQFAQNYISRMINGENINSIGISPEVFMVESGNSWGVYVESVISGSPASDIGVKQNDVIYFLGDSRLYSSKDMSDKEQNDVMTLKTYCNVLKNKKPNNRSNILQIEVMRLASDGELYYCRGEINGLSLSNIVDGSRCPN